jgi:hypothetical protein
MIIELKSGQSKVTYMVVYRAFVVPPSFRTSKFIRTDTFFFVGVNRIIWPRDLTNYSLAISGNPVMAEIKTQL